MKKNLMSKVTSKVWEVVSSYYVKRFLVYFIPTLITIATTTALGLPLWVSIVVAPMLGTLDKFLRDIDWYNTHTVLFPAGEKK